MFIRCIRHRHGDIDPLLEFIGVYKRPLIPFDSLTSSPFVTRNILVNFSALERFYLTREKGSRILRTIH